MTGQRRILLARWQCLVNSTSRPVDRADRDAHEAMARCSIVRNFALLAHTSLDRKGSESVIAASIAYGLPGDWT